jgi:hypothetical protein
VFATHCATKELALRTVRYANFQICVSCPIPKSKGAFFEVTSSQYPLDVP